MENQKNKISDSTVFHNTDLLLKHYRDVVWSLEVSVHRINNSFLSEFGKEIDSFLDMTYEAGLDLSGTEIEAQTKSVARSRNMLHIIDNAVELLRNKHKKGEMYYWILYYTYLSPQEIQSVDEIVYKLSDYIKDISKRTYYRKKNEAVMQLGVLLWGYTAKNCLKIIEAFPLD